MKSIPLKATNRSAFLSGVGLGVLGICHEWLSMRLNWNWDQRNFYFHLTAIPGFVIPVLLFVIGPPYLSLRSFKETAFGWLRMLIYFLGSASTLVVFWALYNLMKW